MTGILGGTATGTALQSMVDATHDEPWYGRERFEHGEFGLCLTHHDERDPGGWLAWRGDGRAGVVEGAIANREELGLDTDDLFASLFDDPVELCARLDGSFVIAGIDREAERIVLATDRLGAHPCYYRADDEFHFASGLGPLLARLDDPTLDEQAVSDMLLLGFVWGEKTLIEGCKALAPATVLEYTAGEVSTERYWSPSFDALPDEGYLDELVRQYRAAIGDAATTVEDTAGLWLSGGLDSRAVAAELDRHAGREFDALAAYTYDANPHGGGNPELAGEIATTLDISLDEVVVTPELFVERLGEAVDHTDGMLRWSSFLNLLSAYVLPDEHAGVIMEGSGLGELLGQHPRRSHFRMYDSATEGLLQSEAMADPEAVQSLLTVEVDPRESFERTVERSGERTHRGRMIAGNYASYYPRMAFASDAVARSQVGTRVPFVRGEFLEHTAGLPMKYRMRTLPFTGGKIPYGILQTKLVLMRALDPRLSAIPYERTGLAPDHPFPLHVAGFVATTGLARLARRTTYGGRKVPDEWYRHVPAVRELFDELLKSACERPIFEAEEIRRLRREHLTGEANHVVGPIAAITTLELWMQRNLD